MTEKVYIILPVHNRRQVTARFIDCLSKQTYQNFHLVLIDDGSTDGTAEMVKSRITEVTVLTGKGDWWWAGSLQQGFEWLKVQNPIEQSIVLITNDDTEFDPDFLEKGVTLLQKEAKTFLLATALCRDTGAVVDAGVNADWSKLSFEQASGPEQINCLSTRGLFLRMEDFLITGGFYPKLLPHYTSDYEFTIRAKRKGIKLTVNPELRLLADLDETGVRSLDNTTNLFETIYLMFSKKTASNPLTWSAFILLSCPWRWKFLNLMRIWKRSGFILIKSMR